MSVTYEAIQALHAASRALWQEYEKKKATWLTKHPGATPDEIAAACRAIADELEL